MSYFDHYCLSEFSDDYQLYQRIVFQNQRNFSVPEEVIKHNCQMQGSERLHFQNRLTHQRLQFDVPCHKSK